METLKFPIFIWEDFEGYFNACLVEESMDLVGVARTQSEAVFQLKEYLAWQYEEEPWRSNPDFLAPHLLHFKTEVRPEYRIDGRLYPADKPMRLRVACVHGHQKDGLLVATIPLLGIRFYYYDAKALKGLVLAYVQEGLKGFTQRGLSRFLPPKSVKLDEIVLQAARQEKHRNYSPSLDTLNAVAEPIGTEKIRKKLSAPWGREQELAQLVGMLGKENSNVILAGESGSGKTTLLAGAARQIEQQGGSEQEDWAPEARFRFWLSSGARIIAGMQYLGQWQERAEEIVGELAAVKGVLCVNSLLDLVLAAGEPAAGVAAFLMPYIERGELQVVAETTSAELEACQRLLPGFVALFQILRLAPLDRQQATSILRQATDQLKRNYQIEASGGIAELVYSLFSRFAPYETFPGRARSFLSSVFERAKQSGLEAVTPDRVVGEFAGQTGLPELFLRDDVPLVREEVLNAFEEQVIGQPSACAEAASLVTLFKSGLNDPARPIGVMLFCGPTGVGKTELAKAISAYFFGRGKERDRLIRLDMSEYAGYGSAERLVSAPDGGPSDLIKRIRRQPFVVLLLDEIEKAAAEVFDVLLSVFDEGRLTDRNGRTAILRSSIIIMTSNLGADKAGAVGFDRSQSVSYQAEAMGFFRPEFFNRIDAVVQFNPLDEASILAVTRKELDGLAKREGLAEAGIELLWTVALIEYLARRGYDPRYGARPLQRTIESTVVAELARILAARPGLKNARIKVDIEDEQVRFNEE
jgi:ATP-dependent Clp protease ATP-binding subunit ClpC